MANLVRSFDIAGNITEEHEKKVTKTLQALNGVNHVNIIPAENKVMVGYTPGIINVQNIKEAIETQGLDVSDQGDD